MKLHQAGQEDGFDYSCFSEILQVTQKYLSTHHLQMSPYMLKHTKWIPQNNLVSYLSTLITS